MGRPRAGTADLVPGVPTLARAAVDRAAARRRDEAWLDAAWRDPRARVLVLADGEAAVTDEWDALLLLAPADAPPGERYFLGLDGDTPVFAVAGSGRLPHVSHAGLRELGALLPDRDAGLLTDAVALSAWHRSHTHCPRCGAPTEAADGGHVRRCPVDGSEHFPRIDPAVIMLVHDGGDRCLLGRQPAWPDRRYSTFAGFVEPGESLEQAVAREVSEEVGLRVAEVTYAASQPWPFPSSLMLGFTARALDHEVRLADDEIEDARWFSRQGLADAVREGSVVLPGRVSIAWWLVSRWLGAQLDG
jgi:NAD+ diphosphatase